MSKYDIAISMGKERMRKSLDSFHNYQHALTVEMISLKVYNEFKRKKLPGIEIANTELIRVIAWWHDCYKATLPKFSVKANFQEGPESTAIIRKELS